MSDAFKPPAEPDVSWTTSDYDHLSLRFFAVGLDALLSAVSVLTGPILLVVLMFVLRAGGVDLLDHAEWVLAVAIVGWLFVSGAQLVSVVNTGQTFGKWCVGLRIVSHDGSPAEAGPQIVRLLVPFVAGLCIPFAAFFDAATIVLREHRCIHDYVAGTKVVSV